jgi:glycosyltransferase involved in cell wall biosynthesis
MVKSNIMLILIKMREIILQLRRISSLLKLMLLRKSEIISLNKKISAAEEVGKYRMYYANSNVVFRNRKRECKLSIIIPVYNAEKYIKTCLDSIFNQNISCSYEVICINDGSDDNSLEIMLRYDKENLKILSQDNSGAGKARNRGLDEASGEYIFFMDADDILPPDAINSMLIAAFASGADIISGTIGKANSSLSMVYYPHKKKAVQTNDLVRACNLMAGTPWGKLYKSCLWNNVRFSERYAYEDTIIFLDIFPKAKEFLVLGSPVYCFRSSNDSLFKRENSSARCVDIIWVIKDALDCALQAPIISVDQYYQVLIWHLSVVIYARLKNLNNEELLKNVFAIAIDINNLFLNHCSCSVNFSGKNAKIYYKVQKSFATRDYLLWLACCKALKNSGEI